MHEALVNAATFICGHPKSGTSLVMTLLDSHPQLVVYPEETRYFRRFIPATEELRLQERQKQAEELILHIFQWSREVPHSSQAGFLDRDYADVSYESIQQAYHRRLSGSRGGYAAILPAAILAFGEVMGEIGAQTLRWVEKSPYNEWFAEPIFRFWPAAQCIHVVRDPRDNYASYVRKHRSWSPETFAYSWRNSIRQAWKNQRRFGVDRYLILRYEDLASTPERALERITRFLGIVDDPILRRPTRNGKPWAGNSMFGERFNGISTSPVGRYQTWLEKGAISELECLLHPEMRRLDYALPGKETLASSGKRLAILCKWSIRRSRRGLHRVVPLDPLRD